MVTVLAAVGLIARGGESAACRPPGRSRSRPASRSTSTSRPSSSSPAQAATARIRPLRSASSRTRMRSNMPRRSLTSPARRYMPPWKPEVGHGDFEGVRRLSDDDITLIRRWVSEGRARGDAADLPPAPRWAAGWSLGTPDLVVTMADRLRAAERRSGCVSHVRHGDPREGRPVRSSDRIRSRQRQSRSSRQSQDRRDPIVQVVRRAGARAGIRRRRRSRREISRRVFPRLDAGPVAATELGRARHGGSSRTATWSWNCT